MIHCKHGYFRWEGVGEFCDRVTNMLRVGDDLD